jgi:hypothetical protein
MCAFALLSSIVFGIVTKDDNRERALYGAKIFAEFVLIGLALAWVLYFLPF